MRRFNPIQVVAGALGAVVAALIASVFGVQGTIIGTAIGSIAATTATAFLWEWIERGHKKVHEVVVNNGSQVPLLRRGATAASGDVTSVAASSTLGASVDAGADASASTAPPSPAPGTARAAGGDTGTGRDAAAQASVRSLRGRNRRDEVGELRFVASSRAAPRGARGAANVPNAGKSVRRRHRTLPVAVSVVAAFVLALGVVTVVELVVGRPLAALLGASHTSSGTSAGNLITSSPPASPPATSPPPTAPSATTTTTTSSSTTTTTTTTTTTPSSPTTTTTSVATSTKTATRSTGAAG
jgi:hypothetical protein